MGGDRQDRYAKKRQKADRQTVIQEEGQTGKDSSLEKRQITGRQSDRWEERRERGQAEYAGWRRQKTDRLTDRQIG